MTVRTGQRRRKTVSTKVITVPENLRLACEEFNSGRYFECHETLEEVWHEDRSGVRDFYKGLIQVAAAFVHLSRGNHKGARRLLRTALGYLEPYFTDGAMGFDVETFGDGARRTLQSLDAAEAAGAPVAPITAPELRWDASLVSAEAMHWGAWGFDSRGNAVAMEITIVE